MAASSIQELIKSRIAVNNPNFSAKSELSIRSELSGASRENPESLSQRTTVSEKFRRPTLLKNPETHVDKARIHVAQAHTTLTRASVQADFTKQAKAHKQAKLGFTRTPRVISKLID